jgi:carboxymethylenebutenolidase
MLAIIALQALTMTTPAADIHFGPEGKYHGYLVRPSGDGPFPAMIVVHEWWGLNDNIRNQATELAKNGYVALAVDLFGKSTTDSDEAMKQVRGLDQKAATAELLAAAEYLRSQPFVKPDRIGSIGWCFGGAQSLNLAINDPKLAAAVIYYGKPVTDPKELAKIHAAILGLWGETDDSIPIASVHEFQEVLTEAGVKNEFHTYPGAGHAFANPSGGHRYNADAAKDAWARALAFLEKHLKR